MTHLAIDGDLLAFKATAVNEVRSVKAKHKETGEERLLDLRTTLKNEVGKEAYKDWEFEDVQSPKNFKFSCNTAEDLIAKWVGFANADTYEIVLSGKDNFRDNLPLPTKYKSNRDGGIRPLHLSRMKEWLANNKGAYYVHGVEGDDKLAELAYQGYVKGEKIIQCTLDKDAWGCMGFVMHMDCIAPPELIVGLGQLRLVDKGKTKDLKGSGYIWMLAQSVLGDAVDGYKPCELAGVKWGDVACYNLLKDCKTYKEAFQAVYNQYREWYPSPVTYTAWDGKEYTKNALEIWQMYFDCARMRRWENDIVDLRDVLTKLEIDYDE